MRMLVNGSLLVLFGVAGLLMAQHGGGGSGGGAHGGGGNGGGGGHVGGGGGGGFHPSLGSGSSGYYNGGGGGGYTTSITPQSYSGHLTFSTPGMGTTGLNRGPSRGVEGRPTWGRPPIRRPGEGSGSGHHRGYTGIGYYPVFGYGYYGNDFNSPNYALTPEPEPEPESPQQQYGAPAYEQAPEAGGGDYSYYPPVPYAAPGERQMVPPAGAPAVPAEPLPPSVPITIVLKSGQKMEVQNYAIMNGMFWDFSKQNAKKIPLNEVDVAASSQATDAAGGAFPEESFVVKPR